MNAGGYMLMKGEKEFQCSTCGKGFSNWSHFKTHQSKCFPGSRDTDTLDMPRRKPTPKGKKK